MPPTSTPEWLCYFLCLRSADPGSAAACHPELHRRAAGLEDINWPNLLFLAQRHGVAPLLYHHLKTSGLQNDVPAPIFQTLHQAYLHNAARNMRLYYELSQILTVLREHGIPVIVLKGAYLAEAVYGNIALRPMVDIDLLVKTEDVLNVGRCLKNQGYQTTRQFWLEAEQTVRYHLPPIRTARQGSHRSPLAPFSS